MTPSTPPRNWIQTFTGKAFTPLVPRHEDVDVRDIAHALALKCRYTGHCRVFYSVAEHSVVGARLFLKMNRRDLALAFLFHDAAEAYLPDIAAPVKPFFRVDYGMDGQLTFDQLEGKVQMAIARALLTGRGSARFDDPAIKELDVGMLLAEAKELMGPHPYPWNISGDASHISQREWGWTSAHAEEEFLNLWTELAFPALAPKPEPKKGKRR